MEVYDEKMYKHFMKINTKLNNSYGVLQKVA